MARTFSPQYTYQPLSLQELMSVPQQLVTTNTAALKEYEAAADKAAALRIYSDKYPELAEYMKDYYNKVNEAADVMTGMNQNGFFDNRLKSLTTQLNQLYRDKPLQAMAGIQNYLMDQKNITEDDIIPQADIMTYVKDPLYSHSSISGNAITTEISNIVKNLAQSMDWRTTVIGNQISYIKGFTEDELISALADDNTSLGKEIAKLRERYNYDKMSDATKQRFDYQLALGLKSGLGSNNIKNNPAYKAMVSRTTTGTDPNSTTGLIKIYKRDPNTGNVTKDREVTQEDLNGLITNNQVEKVGKVWVLKNISLVRGSNSVNL